MKTMKKCLAVVVSLAFLTVLSVMAYAAEPDYGLVVNGVQVVFQEGAGPVNKEGRLLFPLRTVFSALDDGTGAMDWDGEAQMVTISLKGTEMKLWIGNAETQVNGKAVAIQDGVAPIILNDRTYLPIRFVAEQLGLTVGWNEEYKTVTISNKNDYASIKDILEFSSKGMQNRLSLDMNMDMAMAMDVETDGVNVSQEITIGLAAACDIDAENQFMHMNASISVIGEKVDMELYMLGDQMYMGAAGEWSALNMGDLSSGLGFDPTGVTNYLDIAGFKALEDYLGSYDPYLGFGLLNKESNDVIINGVMFLPADILNSIVGSVLGSLGEEAGMQMNLQPVAVTYVFNRETMKLKEINMVFAMDMLIDVAGESAAAAVSYNITINNINFNPKFENVIPDEIIKSASPLAM